MKRLALLFLAGFALFFVQQSVAQPQDQKILIKKDIVYGNGGDEKLMLDLAMPKDGNGPFPAVVCVHGGGWRAGNRQSMHKLVVLLAEKDFVAATISYRLAPKHKFPAQIHDCKAAVRFLRANAQKYKINPKRIGAVGFSAGGHLASLMGAADKQSGLEGNGGHPDQSSRVQAVVNFFGPTDFIDKTWSKQVEENYLIPFLGDKYNRAKKQYKRASPLNYVTGDDPPFLFFHGDKDTLVGIHHSKVMSKRLTKAKVDAKLVVMEGAGHGWVGKPLEKTLAQTIAFFEEKLRK